MTTCTTFDCFMPATRWMTCEGEGEYAYCEECAAALHPYEDDLGPVAPPPEAA